MAVSPRPGDNDGYLLQSNIVSLTTQIAATKSTAHNASMVARLDQLQRELVLHYLDVGRISAATVLSTLS